MIPFNPIRDALDIGVRKEQQTAGDDDSYWKLCLTPCQTIAQEGTK